MAAMGGGNGQKSKMARERNMEKQKAARGSSPLASPPDYCKIGARYKETPRSELNSLYRKLIAF